jgi:hypothetical protein
MPEVRSRTYANPRRLPRRNHYQEGPGILFVATQGGRPAEDRADHLQAAIQKAEASTPMWRSGPSWPDLESADHQPDAARNLGSLTFSAINNYPLSGSHTLW